jgi:maleylpyruvate isomerase
MELYSFFRSGTSHRLRIALNLKGLSYEYVSVDLRKNEHHSETFKALNPQGMVPTLVDGDQVLTQSVAIIEWLEERYPTPALLPSDINDRAYVRALAAIVGCDIHPVNNKRILDTLRTRFGADDAAINKWSGTWIEDGFDAYESMLAADTQRIGFSFGSAPTLADAYLVPQIESARRFKVNLERWPLIMSVEANCNAMAAFQRARPMVQPDAS